MFVRHDRRQWCCPYEVWDGRTFVAAYQTPGEAEAHPGAHWTDQTDLDADVFFATLPDREIRRRQDLCQQQIRAAHEQRNERALADLRRMEDALARTMMARLIRSNGGLEV